VKKLCYVVVVLVLSSAAIYLFCSSQDFDLSILGQLSSSTWVLATSLSLLSLFIYFLCVNTLLRGMGFRRSLKPVSLITLVAGTATLVSPARVGVLVRIFLFKKRLRVPISVGIGAFAVEVSLELLWMTVIFLLAVGHFHEYGNLRVILIVFSLLFTLFCGAVLLRPRQISRFFSRFVFKRQAQRIIDFGISSQQGFKRISKGALVLAGGLFPLKYITQAIFLYFVLSGLGYPMNPFYLLYAKNVSLVAGIVSMIPMGLGAKDVTFMFVLSKLGVSEQVAVSSALMDRFFHTFLPFGLGIISASILGVKFLGNKKRGELIELMGESQRKKS